MIMAANRFWAMVWQIARTEMTLRLRRFSTLIMVLLVVVGGFYMVPDPASGMTVISSNEQRVLYNSAAVAIGGASLATLLISLVGFYLISNSLSRDVRSRMGAILGATPVSNVALLLGKWLGNAGYLLCLVAALIPGSMLVQSLRGEAPIELGQYLAIYALIFLPQVLFIAAIALWFETERWLRGRFGDVLYFFIWSGLLSIIVGVGEDAPLTMLQATFDLTGMGFLVGQLAQAFGTSHLNIGASDFDANLSPIVLAGIEWSDAYLRLYAFAPALLLFAVVLLRFHRYNPDRVKADTTSGGAGWWQGLNKRLQFLRRLLRPVWSVLPRLPQPVARVVADVLLTLSATPIWLLVLFAGWLLALLVPADGVGHSLILSLSAGALACAELGMRDRQSGMWAVLAGTPRLAESFLRWKFASALTTIALFVAVSLLRLAMQAPMQAFSLLIGVVFCAAAALAFAVISQGGKLFAGAYLLLLYLSLNATKEPMFDFAGINGVATSSVWLGYGGAALVLLVLTMLVRRWQRI